MYPWCQQQFLLQVTPGLLLVRQNALGITEQGE
jgi:hypothetical protein